MKNKNSQLPDGKNIWILFDVSNGDIASKRYLWWFDTRQKAREYKHYQNNVLKNKAKLVGPWKFKKESK